MAEFYGNNSFETCYSSVDGTIKSAKRFPASETDYGSPGIELTINYEDKEIKWALYGHSFYGEFLDEAKVNDVEGLEGKLIQVAVNKDEKVLGVKIKEN